MIRRWDETRAAKYRRERQPLPKIDVRYGNYLLTHLMKAGPSSRDGAGGETKLSWSEIYHYCKATGSLPNIWEREALRDLSGAYLEGKAHGKDLMARPYTEDWEE